MTEKKSVHNKCLLLLLFSPLCTLHSKVPIMKGASGVMDILVENLFGSHHRYLREAAILLAQRTHLWLCGESRWVLNHRLNQLVSLSLRNINTFRVFIFLRYKIKITTLQTIWKLQNQITYGPHALI